MKKILIIGKKSFIGSNLFNLLKKNFFIKNVSFEVAIKKKKNYFSEFSHIINTSIHTNYIKEKYDKKYDLDLKFIKKFKTIKFKYIFLNSRKIYFQKENIKETDRLLPKDNYAKNKLITENFLKAKLDDKLISLRTSNIIGNRVFESSRKSHDLFFDNYLKFRKRNRKMKIKNDFKDFLSIQQFSFVLEKIINSNVNGIFNVSLSQKIYISELLKWLDIKFFQNKLVFIKSDRNSFTLSNKKLTKALNIKLYKKDLKKFCKKVIINKHLSLR